MPSDLLIPSSLDEGLKSFFASFSTFPKWEEYLNGRNGVLDPLRWLIKTNEKVAAEIIAGEVAKHGVPYSPLAQHTCNSSAVMLFLATLEARGMGLKDVLDACLPIPQSMVGHVVVFAHCNPTLAVPEGFPRHLCSPVWTTVDDYLRLRLDFNERTRTLWQSFERKTIASTPFKFSPKEILPAIQWLIEQPTISPRDRTALELLLTLPPADLTLNKLPTDNQVAFNSDRGNGPVILPVGALQVITATSDKIQNRARWSEFGALPYFSTSTHLFVAAENPDNSTFKSEAPRDYPGLRMVITHGSGDAIRFAIGQLSTSNSTGSVQRVSKTDDLTNAVFHYDPRKFEGRAPRAYSENIPQMVECIVGEATTKRASDIHIDQYAGSTRILYDIDGDSVLFHSLPKDFSDRISIWLKENACKTTREAEIPGAPREGSFLFGYLGKRITCRVAIQFCQSDPKNPKIVIRIQDPSNGVKDLSELGMEKEEMRVLRANITKKQGLVIVAGATGQGKSTTLMACLQDINNGRRALYTLEDPVEYVMPGIAQIAVASKVEEKSATRPMVTDALRMLLRMAPKAIMVGEIRDLNTAAASIEASNTGHLIFATIHANSSIDVIKRFGSWNVDKTNFGENVKLITSQRLVKRLCGCFEQAPMDEATARVFECNKVPHNGWIGKRKSGGCSRCSGTGYHGRLVIMELLEVNQEISDLISENAPIKAIRAAAETSNYQTLLKSGLRRVATMQTSMEALGFAIDLPVVEKAEAPAQDRAAA